MEEKVTIPAALQWFFGVALRSRSYLNAVYLLLAFPLGIAYFVFLLTGWALGVGLTVIWIGLVILLLVLLLSFALSAFERQQAIHLLGRRSVRSLKISANRPSSGPERSPFSPTR